MSMNTANIDIHISLGAARSVTETVDLDCLGTGCGPARPFASPSNPQSKGV